MGNLKYKILLVLFVVSLISSLTLSLVPKTANEFCSIEEWGCDTLQDSSYNYTFGIYNSYFGIPIFSFLSVLTFFQMKKPSRKKRNLINLSVVFGFLVALYFLYLQRYVLLAYCKYCLVVDLSMVIAFGVVVWKWGD